MNRKNIIRNLRLQEIPFDENLSTKDLNDLLTRDAQNRVTKKFNFANGTGRIQLTFNAAKAEEPASIMICEDIGKDAWTGEGISVQDIKLTLDAITPKTRTLDFFIDSPGGSFNTGCAIHNLLSQWPGVINKTIIGVAASTASWMIPADTTKAFKNSQFFAHRAMCGVFGNEDAFEEAKQFLRKTDGQISQMYADQSGNEPAAMLDLMKGSDGNGTLLTGEEAKKLGLVDEIIDGVATNQFNADWLNSAKQKLSAMNSLSAAPKQGAENQNHNPANTMKDKLALLNKRGVTVPANATEAQLDELLSASNIKRAMNISVLNDWKVTFDAENATDDALTTLVKNGKPQPAAGNGNQPQGLSSEDKELLASLKNQAVENRRTMLRNSLTELASAQGGHRIPVNDIAMWEKEAEAAKDGPDGNSILNALKKLPANEPGIPALNAAVEITGDSFNDVQKFCLENGPRFRKQFLGAGAANKLTPVILKEIGNRALRVANMILKHKNAIIEMWNANAIDSDLQRQVILQDMLRAYALKLLPLSAFSLKFENVPLEGTDEVVVPYFPLQTNASVQFVAGTGYTTANDWTQNSRKVTVGGDGNAATSGANATAGYAKDRLYQRIDFTSYDMRRQPYLNVSELCRQAADKLGVDVFTQIISRVIVVGNYGAAVKTVAAALFTPDDVADLSEYGDTAQWPTIGRSLVLASPYKTPLLKDNTFKQYLSYGATDPIRKAQIQEAYGFENMHFVPALTNYTAANTSGWINHKSAALVAFAPIMPAEGVRALLAAYDVIVDPESGTVMEYRKQANVTTDVEQEIFQSCFGAGPGVQAALKIIKSAP